MKHSTASLRTKKTLSSTLKSIAAKKSFSKITVTELIRACNINRNTFYYHFTDMYDLMKWTLEQEAAELLGSHNPPAGRTEEISFLLDFADKNRDLLNSVYDSLGQEEVQKFFYKDSLEVTREHILALAKDSDQPVSDEYIDFLSHFYAAGIVEIIFYWLRMESPYDKESMISMISDVVYNSVRINLHIRQ